MCFERVTLLWKFGTFFWIVSISVWDLLEVIGTWWRRCLLLLLSIILVGSFGWQLSSPFYVIYCWNEIWEFLGMSRGTRRMLSVVTLMLLIGCSQRNFFVISIYFLFSIIKGVCCNWLFLYFGPLMLFYYQKKSAFQKKSEDSNKI